MAQPEEVKVNGNGVFLRWEKVLELMSRVEQPTAGGVVSIPGLDLSNVLKPYGNKQVKLTIEVLKES